VRASNPTLRLRCDVQYVPQCYKEIYWKVSRETYNVKLPTILLFADTPMALVVLIKYCSELSCISPASGLLILVSLVTGQNFGHTMSRSIVIVGMIVLCNEHRYTGHLRLYYKLYYHHY
jgi:hypothetical protein